MGTRALNIYVDSKKSPEQLKEVAIREFRSLGGNIISTPSGFQIISGNLGVSMKFLANLGANVVIVPIKEGAYEIQVFLGWNLSSTFWTLLIFGIFLGGIGLLLILLYLFYDPTPVYQQVLYRITNYERLQLA